MTNAANTSYEGRVTSSGTTRTLRPGPPQPSIPTRSGASPTTRTNRTDLQDLTSYLPMMVPIVVVSQILGRVMSATGRYKMFPILGGAFIASGTYLLSTMDANTSRLTTGLYTALFGAGLGFMMQMTVLIAQNSVELKDMGVASGAATLFRTLGGSVGVALFGSLLNRRITEA